MSIKNNWLAVVFRSNLKFLMNLREKSQADLAREMGVSKTQISKLLGNESNPTLETLLVLARLLRVPPQLLISVPVSDWIENLEPDALSLFITFTSVEEALHKFQDAKWMVKSDDFDREQRAKKKLKK